MNNRRILPFQGWRLLVFQAVVVFSLLILVVRTGELQFVNGDQFVQDAEENRLQVSLIAAPRGAIYDRYRVPLAKNDPAYNVLITPADLPADDADTLDVYNRLSAQIDVPATRAAADAAGRTNERSIDEMVREGLGIAPFTPVVIATDIDRNAAFRIMEQAQLMPGVEIQVASVREYPTGSLTAHIIGYLGPIGPEEEQRLREQGYNPAFDRIGYAGIEAYMEDQLAGARGAQTWVVDVAGQPLQLVEEQPFQAGESVQLTLDLELQKAAQEALTREINLVNKEANRVVTQQGVVIAINPNNGDILAMVSWPSYDNTRFARNIDGDYYFNQFEDPLRPLVNHAISALYPPGSVWKLITSVGVVEEDVIDPNQTLYDPGRLVLPNAYAPFDDAAGQPFVCWDRAGHGNIALVNAIAQSCDVYFYQVGGGNPDVSPAILKTGGLGIFDLYRWATAFGIGSELGVELPGELAGRMPDSQWKRRNYGESWSTGDTYNAAFGQGYVTVTPLQLLASTAAIINGGTLYEPHLVRNLQDANGNIIEEFQPRAVRTIVKPTDGSEAVLLLQEDMLLNGPNSLACRCEEDSDTYDPALCTPDDYHSSTTDASGEGTPETIAYTVHVPYNYSFNGGVCDPLEYESINLNQDDEYTPPFSDPSTLGLVREGMRDAVTVGTAKTAALTYVNVAGKTGTAEYCDDIAWAQGLCEAGSWPAHAWFVGYAPYENPEVAVIAFVYNGDEGSAVAAPIVNEVLDAYFKLKIQRGQQ
ncbi:MAG TPA: penicillin-binding protein 2 [Aggregatilinea sp.]|jgi:penicillin-binding protein 2|uniref:penicillin-binding protein 2 n=1 Tax=Aggregatilinea sp. TaxID=2806333 RepID=UPI002D11CD00|nr:penicillin-binding protein 2 [Aggregatilinea sp.]HML24045.1 penicillin-binding protein 2 [Aggregatilinea sp.]